MLLANCTLGEEALALVKEAEGLFESEFEPCTLRLRTRRVTHHPWSIFRWKARRRMRSVCAVQRVHAEFHLR